MPAREDALIAAVDVMPGLDYWKYYPHLAALHMTAKIGKTPRHNNNCQHESQTATGGLSNGRIVACTRPIQSFIPRRVLTQSSNPLSTSTAVGRICQVEVLVRPLIQLGRHWILYKCD